MEQIERYIIPGIGSVLTYIFGGWSVLLTTLLVLNVLDYLTGSIANWPQRSSQKAFSGAIKKGLMWMWIGIANLIYLVFLHLDYAIGVVIPNFAALYFIIVELISLEENSRKLGLETPTYISNIVQKLKDIFNSKSGGNMK